MSGKSYLLDTNVVIRLFKGDRSIEDFLRESEVFLSAIVVGELFYGIENSSNAQRHSSQVNNFLDFCTVIQVDEKTAELYGEIKTKLKRKGKPIPENDIWIMATSKQYNLPLFTFDKHFLEIESLNLVRI